MSSKNGQQFWEKTFIKTQKSHPEIQGGLFVESHRIVTVFIDLCLLFSFNEAIKMPKYKNGVLWGF